MRRLALLCAVLACGPQLAAAAAAHASPVPTSAASIGIATPRSLSSFWYNPTPDCILLDGGWNPDGGSSFVGTSFRPRGLLDVPHRSGEAILPGEAIHLERFDPRPARALGAVDVGLELAGRGAYLTGTIRPVRATSVGIAPRRRLARLSRVSIVAKANQGHLLVTVRGRATMLAPLASAIERLRCKGRQYRNHPVRAGQALGTVTAALDPARATALAGTTSFAVDLSGSALEPPSVQPTGGAHLRGTLLQLAWAPGTRVPTMCASATCVPANGSVTLAGGFDLVDGATRVSFTDLAVAQTGQTYAVTATVGGANRTIATGDATVLALTADMQALLDTAFGDPALVGDLSALTFAPTQLAPA